MIYDPYPRYGIIIMCMYSTVGSCDETMDEAAYRIQARRAYRSTVGRRFDLPSLENFAVLIAIHPEKRVLLWEDDDAVGSDC